MTAQVLFLVDGPWRVGVDAGFGGHLVEFSIAGLNALSVAKPEIGSTFWPSPQAAWGWPPPLVLDKGPYQIDHDGDEIRVTSPVCPQTGLRLHKHFALRAGRLSANYTMRNCGDIAVQYAPWEITRVDGGITFYESVLPPVERSTGHLLLRDGVAWHEYKPHQQVQNEKIFGNGSTGWLANFHQGLLLVKQFEPVPVELVAPGEAEIEIYSHGDPQNAYIEIEQQGRYEVMPPDCEVRWQVIWNLRQWPDAEAPAFGSSKLVAAARSLLSQTGI